MKTVNRNNLWFPSLLENLFLENRLDVPTQSNNWEKISTPAVNIIENIANFVIEVAAPGMEKENFTVEVEKETLTISAKAVSDTKEETTGENDSRFRRREFNYTEFTRSFKMPESINTENIEANYNNGILRVTLPKTEEVKEFKKMVEIS